MTERAFLCGFNVTERSSGLILKIFSTAGGKGLYDLKVSFENIIASTKQRLAQRTNLACFSFGDEQ
jgi:hypothetical protein